MRRPDFLLASGTKLKHSVRKKKKKTRALSKNTHSQRCTHTENISKQYGRQQPGQIRGPDLDHARLLLFSLHVVIGLSPDPKRPHTCFPVETHSHHPTASRHSARSVIQHYLVRAFSKPWLEDWKSSLGTFCRWEVVADCNTLKDVTTMDAL